MCKMSLDFALKFWLSRHAEQQNDALSSYFLIQFSSVQSLSCVRLFVTPWITARQASLSITNSRNLPRLMSIKSVMPSSHLIPCHPLLLLPPILPSIRQLVIQEADNSVPGKLEEFSCYTWSFEEKCINVIDWQPTPVFLPGESHEQRNLVGCYLWGRTESDTTWSSLAAAADKVL